MIILNFSHLWRLRADCYRSLDFGDVWTNCGIDWDLKVGFVTKAIEHDGGRLAP